MTTATHTPQNPPPTPPARLPASSPIQGGAPGAAPTPVRMRRVAIACVAACVAFALAIGTAGVLRARSLSQAADHTEQAITLTTADAAAADAAALATNAFLVGGLEDATVRRNYLTALETATEAVTAASSTGLSPRRTMSRVAGGLVEYAGLIEAARANNRQGYPIGGAYLREASNQLQWHVLDTLDAEIEAQRAAVTTSTPGGVGALAVVASLLGLAVLAAVSLWLSGVTRRTLNKGLSAAMVLVVAAALGGWIVSTWTNQVAANAARGPLARTIALSKARVLAFDAKTAEAQTLIAQGSGEVFAARYDEDVALARSYLREANTGSSDRGLFAKWVATHAKVQELDESGKWSEAVALATDNTDGSNAQFAQFAADSARQLDAAADEAVDALGSPHVPLLVTATLAALAGLCAAVAAWAGIGTRIKEYM